MSKDKQNLKNVSKDANEQQLRSKANVDHDVSHPADAETPQLFTAPKPTKAGKTHEHDTRFQQSTLTLAENPQHNSENSPTALIGDSIGAVLASLPLTFPSALI